MSFFELCIKISVGMTKILIHFCGIMLLDLTEWFDTIFVIDANETMTTKGKTMKSFGYLRVSHLESLNGTSFDTQEKKIRQYAELHDLKGR